MEGHGRMDQTTWLESNRSQATPDTSKVWSVRTSSQNHTVTQPPSLMARSTQSATRLLPNRDSSPRIPLSTNQRISDDSLTSHFWDQEEIMMNIPNSSMILSCQKRIASSTQPSTTCTRPEASPPPRQIPWIHWEHSPKKTWAFLTDTTETNLPSLTTKLRPNWAHQSPISTSSQSYWRARSAPDKTSLCSLTVSRKSSPRTKRINKWLFQSRDMLVIREEIDLKTSSERASESNLYNLRSCKESLSVHLTTSNWCITLTNEHYTNSEFISLSSKFARTKRTNK